MPLEVDAVRGETPKTLARCLIKVPFYYVSKAAKDAMCIIQDLYGRRNVTRQTEFPRAVLIHEIKTR